LRARLSLLLCLAASLVTPVAAQAADCAEPYTLNVLLADMVAAEGFLRAGDTEPAKTVAVKMESGLACLDAKLPRPMVARTFRVIGAGLVGAGEDRGKGWFAAAADVEPGFDYGVEELPADSPIRFAYLDAKGVSAEEEGPTGKTFADGDYTLDGKGIDEPKAKAGRPHLLQQEAGGVSSWVIQGADFPAEVLADAAVAVPVAAAPEPKAKKVKEPKAKKVKEPKPDKEQVAKAPKEPKPEKEKVAKAPKPAKKPKETVSSDGSVQVGRKRPWEKTPLMIGGGVLMAAGGGIYMLAGQKRGEFDASNSLAEVDDLQGQINRLVILSAAVTAVGAGTLTWGVILDGGAPMPAVQLRF
jgi:hypothetical protein